MSEKSLAVTGPNITEEGRQKIMRGETILATRPNSHNADGYLPCRLKIICAYVGEDSTGLKLQALDHESGEVLIEMGTFYISVGGSLQFDVEGEPIMAIVWPFTID